MLKGVLITSGVWFVVMLLVGFSCYKNTKTSYYSVGYNDGVIQARWEFLEELKRAKTLRKCDLKVEGLREVLSVKTSSLYLMNSSNEGFLFCVVE